MYICYIYIYAATWVDLRKASLMLDIVFAWLMTCRFWLPTPCWNPFSIQGCWFSCYRSLPAAGWGSGSISEAKFYKCGMLAIFQQGSFLARVIFISLKHCILNVFSGSEEANVSKRRVVQPIHPDGHMVLVDLCGTPMRNTDAGAPNLDYPRVKAAWDCVTGRT